MSSINFNSAATSALRTLQSSNTALNETQKRISTGLAIGEAKDNAAYWSIATTMQSDNKSLSTVTDALGLGAATVDTAYQGLSASKDVLDEIKKKLTAALGSNVDRTAIQAEIDSLQDQLKSIANSSTFSGENWLSVNSALTTYTSNKTVVSSFTRDISGSVSIGSIQLDTKNTVLFDSNAAAASKGILDSTSALTVKVNGVDTALAYGGTGASGNTSTAGLTNVANTATNYTAGTGTGAVANFVLVGTGNFATAGFNIGDDVNFNISLDGGVTQKAVSVRVTYANKNTVATFRSDLLSAINANPDLNGKFTVDGVGGDVAIHTVGQGTDAKFRVSSITAADRTSGLLGLTAPVANGVVASGTKPEIVLGTYDPTAGVVGDKIRVSLSLGSGAATTYANVEVTLTDAMMNSTAATAAAAFATALNTALDASAGGDKLDVVATGTTIKVTGKVNQSDTTNDRVDITALTSVVNVASTGAMANVVTAGTAGADVAGTGTKASVVFDKFEAVQLDGDDTLSLTFAGSAFTVNKAAISAALTTTDGKISSVDQMVTVLNSLASTNYVASKNADGKLVLSSKAAGTGASAVVTAVAASKGTAAGGAGISVNDIDISDATLTTLGADTAEKRVQAITAYINVVNAAINKVTAAATAIGAIGKRIDLQKTFVTNLMDTITKGVSGLVDADMNAESTKLQALQVKQQLGVQALSIANQSAQSVLSLFRS